MKEKLQINIVGEQTGGEFQWEPQMTEGNFLVTLYNMFLLKRGQDVDDFNEDLKAKLEYDILNLEVVGVIADMVKKGINFTSENRAGKTSLHYMVVEKPVDYIKKLIDLGLDFSIKDKHGCSCTFSALSNGLKDVFEILHLKGFPAKAPMREIFILYKR